jgi:Ca2+-binding RTX toxin-like protein
MPTIGGPTTGTSANDVIRGTALFVPPPGGLGSVNVGGNVYENIDNASDINAAFVNGALYGLGGNDVLIGDLYDRKAYNTEGDQLFGGNGNDKLYGDTGPEDPQWATRTDGSSDTLHGGNGDDRLFGGGSYDYLFGDAGNDKLFGQSGDDTIEGNAGNDIVEGGDGTDTIYGDTRNGAATGNDILNGGAGNDYIEGNKGSDTLNGGAGNDRLFGEAFQSANQSGARDLVTYATATAAVRVDLNKTSAQSTGGSGADQLWGIEDLQGSAFGDRLTGNAFDNRLSGGGGKDVIIGGLGADVLTGGLGNDTFVYKSIADSGLTASTRDHIVDFRTGDKIDLSAIDANKTIGGMQHFTLDKGGAFSAGEVKLSDAGAHVLVSLNVDADAAAEMTFLVLNRAGLKATDFQF